MLRKTFLTTLLLCAIFFAQNVVAEDVIYVKSTESDSVPAAKSKSANLPTSHWAVFVDAGANIFAGDFNSAAKTKPAFPTVGAGFTYNFNGTWGIGASYAYGQYKTFGDTEKGYPEILLSGQTHRGQAFVTFDIVNMWRPYGKKIVAANLFAGAGAAFYTKDIYYDKSTDANFETFLSDNGKFSLTPYYVFGADLQFNVTKGFSLGVKAAYNLFADDQDLDVRNQGAHSDGIIDFAVSLRYKIGARNAKHVSNESAYGEMLAKVDQQLEEKIVETVIREVVTVQEAPRKHEVQVVRRDTIVVENVRVEYQTPQKETHYLYYDLNKSALSDDGFKTIQQVAVKMRDNEDLYAEIVGYGDNTGSEEFNEKLTKDRATNVYEELTQEHGISADRLICYSGGIIQGKRQGTYSPNRRVEIRLMSKEDFEAAVKNVPAQKVETTKEAKAEPVTSDAKYVVVEEGMTLSSIAWMEYKDANCWIYIYEANKNTISDPSKLQLGQKIMIPVLTSAQKASVKNVGF